MRVRIQDGALVGLQQLLRVVVQDPHPFRGGLNLSDELILDLKAQMKKSPHPKPEIQCVGYN